MNEDTTIPGEGPIDAPDVFVASNIFDVERFQMVSKVAEVMARASLIPDHLRIREKNHLPYEAVYANCFVIANLALTWGLDPFQVAQATSVTYGKVTLEGKLVRAIIRKFLKFDFSYAFFGNAGDMARKCYISDEPLLNAEGAPLSEEEIIGLIKTGRRITVGTLQKWHTKKNDGSVNENWARDEDKMFRERGAREWCRQWSPGLMLGVYTPDEFDDVEYRGNMARDVTPRVASLSGRFGGQKSQGFNPNNIAALPGETVKMDSIRQEDREPVSQSAANERSSSLERGADSEKRGDSPSSGVSAATIREYADSLLRWQDEEKLKKGHEKFWETKGINIPSAGKAYQVMRDIYGIHLSRIRKELSTDDAKAKVDTVVEAVYE